MAKSTSLQARSIALRGGTLSTRAPNGRERSVAIGPQPRVIGRHASCDLVLEDRKVSATHAELVATEQGVRLRDLGSTNGTFIGSTRVHDIVLTAPTVLLCGGTSLEFEPGAPERLPLAKTSRFGPLVGSSPAMRALYEQLRSIAPTTLSVLVHGETGSGKELVAQAIHAGSLRAGKPFLVIDCAAIPSQLAESKLFGHEKGAFTGALSKHVSPFVEASGGTVFLDEIGELPMDLQPKLLRALAEQRIQSVGSSRYVPIDVRVVCATHRDLPKAINQGTFRSDLFFRIQDVRVEVPPLRERRADIPELVAHMLAEAGEAKAIKRIRPESLERLLDHDWPGNVRELRSTVRRALAFGQGGPLDLALGLQAAAGMGHEGPAAARGTGPSHGQTHAQWIDDADRAYFVWLTGTTGGNISEMARRSGLERSTIRGRLQKHHLHPGGEPARK